jgi:exodeoxyribonuclease V beta subunit
VVGERRAFGTRRRIEGLLTGRIDLVYRHADRYYLLDYKSNLLPDYDPATLTAAVRHSEYDLQYVLYTLALHRWLRFRFCRGLEPDGDPLRGVHAARPSRVLIDALDALFAGDGGASA